MLQISQQHLWAVQLCNKIFHTTKHFSGLSRTTFIFKYFQHPDFATFKFRDFQGQGGTLWKALPMMTIVASLVIKSQITANICYFICTGINTIFCWRKYTCTAPAPKISTRNFAKHRWMNVNQFNKSEKCWEIWSESSSTPSIMIPVVYEEHVRPERQLELVPWVRQCRGWQDRSW